MSLADDFDSIPASGGATAAAPSLADEFDALPVKPSKVAATKPAAAPSAAQAHETTPLDYLGAAVEPLLTAGSSAIAAPVGGAVRLASAALGNTYEGAKQAGNKIQELLTYHPQTQGGQTSLAGIGNMASGVKNAVMNSPVGPALSAVGDAYNNTFVNGQNPLMATVNSMVPGATASMLLPAAGKVAGSVVDGSIANKLRTMISGEPVPEQGSIPFGTNTRAPVPQAAQAAPAAQAAAPKPNYRPNGDGTFTQVPPARSTVPPTAQATPGASAQPGVSQPAAATPTPVPTFEAPELPKPKTTLPVDQQQANIDTMRAIGLDTQRQSAVTGDKFTAGQEYQHAKLDSPMGDAMRGQLQQEQNALKNFATGIVTSTGANAAAPEAMGQAIRAPLQGLSDHYDNAIGALYQVADQRAAGAATVQPDAFGKLLGTDSMFAGKNENVALRRGINAYAREQGIIGTDGTLQPMDVQKAEGMRQYLNSQWSPQNSGLIGKIKESLDTDVAKAGGDDIYTQARALHAERKNTLDNPNGIASLLNESGPNGINQAVPDEKVATKLMSMPTNQFSHIVDTINGLPPELQVQGQQALAEIKGAIAKRIYAAGDSGGTQNGPSMWNAAKVTKELNAQSSKMARVFSPEEIAQFQTLNNAGHILQTPSAYPGAAVQGHNLLQRGMIYAPPAIGAAVGHAIGGVPGAFVGSSVGTGLAAKISRATDVANANKLMQQMANPQVVTPK